MMSWFASCMTHIYLGMIVKYFKEDLPDLLGLTANALRGVPWPTKVEDVLDRDVAFALVPIGTGILVLGSAPFLLAFRSHKKASNRTYHITRMLLLKGMGFVYFFAFLTSALSSRALFGIDGLTEDVVSSPSSRPTPAFDLLRYFWGGELNGDMAVEAISWFGIVLSMALFVVPRVDRPCWAGLPLLCYLTYLSLVNLSSTLMINYGWEWETLEIGFLMIFLCPLFPFSTSTSATPHTPPVLVIFLLRFGVFRLMYGAGMSKLGRSSSKCWRDLTCTMTHYETQPMPNPFAWFFHRLPAQFHQFEVLLTFFEQLVLPWLALVPHGRVNTFAALCELFFQFMIVGTGNYAWINYIGALPCLSLLDDAFFSRWFGPTHSSATKQRGKNENDSILRTRRAHSVVCVVDSLRRASRRLIDVCLVFFVVFKSTAPLKELYTTAPWLHFYDDYFFVNAHGVFGFINSHRVQPHLEYTHESEDRLLGAPCDETRGVVAHDRNREYTCADLRQHCENVDAQLSSLCPRTCGRCVAASAAADDDDYREIQWKSLDFNNLPGDVSRRPYVTSPYHSRLSWQVWIETTARMERFVAGPQKTPYPHLPIPNILRSLIGKILSGNADAVSLVSPTFRDIVRCDDFTGGIRKCRPPTAVRLRYYRYTFSSWDALMQNGTWWERVPLSRSALFMANVETTEYRVEKSSSSTTLYCAAEEREWLLSISVVVAVSILALRDDEADGSLRVFRIASDRAFELCVFAAVVFGAAFCSDYSDTVGSFIQGFLFSGVTFSKTRYYKCISVGILLVCLTHVAVVALTKSRKRSAPAVTDSGNIAFVAFSAAAYFLSWRAADSCAISGI